jgi:hypothetical protein
MFPHTLKALARSLSEIKQLGVGKNFEYSSVMLRMNLSVTILGLVMALLITGCSWQGTSADRGGDLHNGTPADWNSGTGMPDSGKTAAGAPAPAPAMSPAK